MLSICTRIFLLGASIAIASLSAQPVPLPLQPSDVQYSKAVDRLIMIAPYLNSVHLVHPLTAADTTISLNLAPLSLSVSPDGTHAAIGHDGWISYVNLTAGSVEKTIPTAVKANTVVLAGNGNVWVPPLTTVNIASGQKTTALSGPLGVVRPALHPNGNWIYFTRGGSPDDVIKGDTSSGTFQLLYDSIYHGEFPICDGTFFGADGKRLLTGCGTLFRTTAGDDDLKYAGSLSVTPYLVAAADSAVTRKLSVIPRSQLNTPNADSEVHFYDNEYFRLLGRVALPNRTDDSPWHGRYLLYNSDATRLYVVLRSGTDDTAANNFAIYSITLSSIWGCGASLNASSANLPAGGGKVDINLTATSACLSQAVSSASWLYIDSGGVLNGSGTVTIRAIPNLQTGSRTGTVTISGITYTVTQDAAVAPGANPVIPSPARPTAAGYSPALDRMVLASASPDLLTILDPVTGSNQLIPLVLPPTSLSISTDGLHAAVGHDAWITYVDLATAKVESILPVTTSVFDLALGSRDIYAFPLRNQWAALRVVNITSGTEVLAGRVLAGSTAGKISANGKYLYINGSTRIDTTQPPPVSIEGADGNTTRIWFSQDGSRLFSGTGKALRLSDIAAQDLQYIKTVQQAGIVAVADSSVRQMTAIVARSTTEYGHSLDDTSITFLSQQYLNPVGSLSFPKFTSGTASFHARGRHLFWNAAGSRLFAVLQADENSGLLSDYAIMRVSMNAGCNTSLDRTSASAPAAGGTLTLAVTAAAGCGWKASSTAPWLTILANAFSAGSASLSYLVDANPTTSARSATIVVDGQTLTVTQAAGTEGPVPMVNTIPFRVTDAEYSRTLDRIVAISASPSRLSIYDPATGRYTQLDLPMPGNALSVAPNGIRAAVCHDGLLSIVDLQALAIEKSLPVPVSCFDLVLAGNGYAYLSSSAGSGLATAIELSTGVATKTELGYSGISLQLNPAGDAIYTSNPGVSGGSVSRYRITGGPMAIEYRSEPYPVNALGSKVWFTLDGRMMGDSANLFRNGSTPATDFIYSGALSGYSVHNGAVAAIAHSTTRRMFASIGRGSNPFDPNSTDSNLVLHGDKYLALASKLPLPRITAGATSATNYGKFVFWDRSGRNAYVIMQADPTAGLPNDFAVYTLSPEFTPGCPVTLGLNSATASAPGQPGSFAVNAAADCVWEAKSSASWVQIDSGTLGVGVGNLAYTVLPNYTTAQRTATLTIGTQTFTLTQSAAANQSCTFSLGQTALTTSAQGDSLPVKVTASSPNCVWSAQTGATWITPSNVGVKTGSASLRFTVAANPATSARSATIEVAGQTLTVTQSASGCSFDVPTLPLTIAANGATASLNVATGAGCAWTPAGAPSWVGVNGGTTGNGVLNYSVSPHVGSTARAGFISVADKVVQVIQLGSNPAAVFQDVPLTHPFSNHIALLKGTGVTKGCTATTFCPDQSTTRGQMAAFLLRAILGDTFDYPPTPYFTDVPETHPFFNYIQKLRELGVTAGCTPTAYCPEETVTRGQMAAFLIRARLGIKAGDPLTYTTTPYFLDTLANHPFFGYIQKMKDLGITSGVTATTYGPDDPNTRGQMAVFLMRGLLTP